MTKARRNPTNRVEKRAWPRIIFFQIFNSFRYRWAYRLRLCEMVLCFKAVLKPIRYSEEFENDFPVVRIMCRDFIKRAWSCKNYTKGAHWRREYCFATLVWISVTRMKFPWILLRMSPKRTALFSWWRRPFPLSSDEWWGQLHEDETQRSQDGEERTSGGRENGLILRKCERRESSWLPTT